MLLLDYWSVPTEFTGFTAGFSWVLGGFWSVPGGFCPVPVLVITNLTLILTLKFFLDYFPGIISICQVDFVKSQIPRSQLK